MQQQLTDKKTTVDQIDNPSQMTNAEYHARPELSASQCKVLLENPHKYYLGLGTEETEAMRFGSLVHKLILEPEDFDREYAVSPKFDGRTKKGQADKAQFKAENQAKSIITIDSTTSLRNAQNPS